MVNARLISILFLIFVFCPAYTQKKVKVFEVEEIKKADLGNKPFKDFPEASARILFDYGEVDFVPTAEGYSIERTRHLRIKLLDDTLLSAHKLGLTNFEKDELVSFTHWSLNGNNMLEKDIGEQWESINKFVPLSREIKNFKKGDILDFLFKQALKSPEDFPGWQFEYEIPVDYSEWYAEIPGMFKYRPIFKGYVPFVVNSNEILKDKSKSWVEVDGFYIYQYRFVCSDIEPFEKTVYSPSSKNYLTSVSFYLEEVKAYKNEKEMKGQSWENVSSQLFANEKLMGRIEGFDASEIVQGLSLDSNQLKSTVKLYEWVKNNVKWNGDIGIFAEESLSHVVSSKTGSIAEINLLLTALLNKAGIQARPVILRTIDQGEVNMEFPNSAQFNYLICWVDLKGEKLFLDGSDDCLSPGILRPVCLNNRALVITPRFEEWADLEENRAAKYKIVTQARIENGQLLGKVDISKLNYFAYEDCQNFNDVRELVRIEPTIQIVNVRLGDRNNLSGGNRIQFDCIADSIVKKSGSSWTFEPFWFEKIKDSPFKEDERKFPIVFPYLFEYHWNFVLSFDESIEISSIPENAAFTITDKTMNFTYQVIPLDGVLQINAQLSIIRRRYDPYLYESILDFYEDIYEKFKEQLKIKVKL